MACQYAEKQRDDECQQTEEQSAAYIEPQMVHVNLKAREEHEVEKTHLTEDRETLSRCREY